MIDRSAGENRSAKGRFPMKEAAMKAAREGECDCGLSLDTLNVICCWFHGVILFSVSDVPLARAFL